MRTSALFGAITTDFSKFVVCRTDKRRLRRCGQGGQASRFRSGVFMDAPLQFSYFVVSQFWQGRRTVLSPRWLPVMAEIFCLKVCVQFCESILKLHLCLHNVSK